MVVIQFNIIISLKHSIHLRHHLRCQHLITSMTIYIRIKHTSFNASTDKLILFIQSCMDTPIADRRRRRDSPLLKKEQPITRTEEAQVSFTVLSESVVQNKANGKICSS